MRKDKNNKIPTSEYFPESQDFPAPEYQPLPDEYLQREHPVESVGRGQKRRYLRMLCMLTACMLFGYSTYQAEAGQAEVSAPSAMETQSPAGVGEKQEDGENGENSPVQSQTAENKADAAIADKTEPSAGQYPLEGGILYYKIYNETMLDQPTADAWERILEEGEISVEQLLAGEVIELPQPETPEGFTFLGWAAHFRGEKEAYPKWSLLTESFTAEEAARIQPDAEGNRSVDIHAVWRTQEPGAWQMTMILDAAGGTIEGQASQTYNALTPKYSGGTVYLCGYPVPEREGYRFLGWYLAADEGEIRMETLPASRFFGEKNGETDYGQPLELCLVAKWEKTEEKGN